MDATVILIPALCAAAVTFLLAMLFIEWRRHWFGYCLLFGLATTALGLPLYAMRDVLGLPDPAPAGGTYELVGWKNDEYADQSYLFVAREGEVVPRHFAVAFDMESALQLHRLAESVDRLDRVRISIERGQNGDTIFVPSRK